MENYQKAGYPYLWATTTEEDRIIRENRAKIDPAVKFFKWDIVSGVQAFVNPNGDVSAWMWQTMDEEIQDPQGALQFIQQLPEDSIVFMLDYHKYFQDITVVRQALNIKDHLKQNSKMIVFLSAVMGIPLEMAEDVTIFDFEMPNAEAHRNTLGVVCQDTSIDMPEDAPAIVDALRGLTQVGAENALAKTLVDEGKFDVKPIVKQKASKLAANGVLSYSEFTETEDDLFGYGEALSWMKETANHPLAKATMFYGVPGCAKTLVAKVISNIMKRPMLTANLGRLRGSLQGESEAKTDMMFKTIYALGNPYVFVDEFEKSVAGSGASQTDGGTGQRILQQLLINLEDQKPGGPHWIFTVNSLDDILDLSGGALFRRIDITFFFDLPGKKECAGISKIWNKKYDVEIPEDYNLDGFSGADIAKLARNMAMKSCDVDEARKFMIPTMEAMPKKVEEIRKKARSVCIWASEEQETSSVRRKIKL